MRSLSLSFWLFLFAAPLVPGRLLAAQPVGLAAAPLRQLAADHGTASSSAVQVPRWYGVSPGRVVPGQWRPRQDVRPQVPPRQNVRSPSNRRTVQRGPREVATAAVALDPEPAATFEPQDSEIPEELAAPPMADEGYPLEDGLVEREPGYGQSCGTGSCGGPGCVVCSANYWFRSEYLLWWTSDMPAPPLVTRSPNGTPQGVAGVLGEPTTTVLFGSDQLSDDDQSGALFTLGYQIPCTRMSIEGTYLFLEPSRTSFAASSGGDPVLARPLLNVQNGTNDAALIGFTDLVDGSVVVDAQTKFAAAEALLRYNAHRGCLYQVDFLFGYRYGRLKDRLDITESTRELDGPAPGATTDLADHFSARNEFSGAEVGTLVTYRRRCWSLELLAKLALGGTSSRVTIDGETTVTDVGGGSVTRPVGLLARSTNIGEYQRGQFAVLPEVGATLRYALLPRLQGTVGYHFLYWSRVARAGDQIDLALNLSEPFSGAPLPKFSFDMTDFWAQGLDIGLEYRF